ncbi:hypothetical protein A2U01_0108647, partial [Trifolium medium]|nr:hypothetical protein [Trifolium medium]
MLLCSEHDVQRESPVGFCHKIWIVVVIPSEVANDLDDKVVVVVVQGL